MDRLSKYKNLLDSHFGKVLYPITAWTGKFGIYGIEDKSEYCDVDLLGINDSDRIYFDMLETEMYDNPTDAENELISIIKKFIKNSLKDNNPKTKILFWRHIPQIDKTYDFDLNKSIFTGYARMAIYNG